MNRLHSIALCGVIAVAFSGCNRDPELSAPATGRGEAANWQWVELADDHPVMTAGREAAGQLVATLLARVTSEMQSVGPVGAIHVCRDEAIELTGSVARAHGTITEIKRTTDRLRNPLNQPDAAEQLALDRFNQLLDQSDGAPGSLVQAAPAGDGSIEHRFYQPIFLAGACLQCHGKADDIPSEVAVALAELYPEDQATGYAEGDWRGLIRVSMVAGSD